jgi:hypothetical protein
VPGDANAEGWNTGNEVSRESPFANAMRKIVSRGGRMDQRKRPHREHHRAITGNNIRQWKCLVPVNPVGKSEPAQAVILE